MALTTAQIQQAYVTFFSRPADAAGLNYWSSYNGSVADLYATFAQQAEYTAAFNGLSSSQKVNVVYQNLFGRDAEPTGLLYWAKALDAGTVTVANLALAVSAGAQGADGTTVTNRVTAATAFTAALDTTAEILGYSGATANAAAKTWLSAVKDTAASLTAATAGVDAAVASTVSVGGAAGSTFTLTTGVDTITGTSGADKIIGDWGTTGQISGADQIDGGAGTDTVVLYGTPGTLPQLKNVEVLDIFTAANAAIDVSAVTGITKFVVEQADALNTKTITTGNGVAVQLGTTGSAGTTAGAVTWAASATDAAANLTLAGYNTGTAAALTVTGAATTTLNINSTAGTGTSNKISTLTVPATTTKLVITGDKALTVSTDTSGAALKTIDASGATGAVSIVVNGINATTTFTGGSGNDTITFKNTNTFTSADTVDGGAGIDTLAMNAAQAVNVSSSTTTYTKVTNIETLKVNDATTAGDFIDLKAFGAVNMEFGAASTATTTVRNINNGATLTLADAGTTALTIGTDTSADALTVKVKGAGVTYTLDASQFETLNLDTNGATGTSTFAITDTQLKTVTLVNKTSTGTFSDQAVDLGTLSSTVVSSVDLSAFAPATATNGVTLVLSNAAVNGATVTGSANNDTITGSSQADTINGGAGADTITGAGGVDTITTGAGADTIVLGTAAANRAIITDFTNGSTGDVLKFADSKANNSAHGAGAAVAGDIVAYATSGNLTGAAGKFIYNISVENATTLSTDGASVLGALVSGSGAGTITAANAADKLYFLVSDGTNVGVYRGAASGVTADTAITADEISLIAVLNADSLSTLVAGNFTFAA